MSNVINNTEEVRILNSNSTTTVTAVLGTSVDLFLPSTLANCIINLEFFSSNPSFVVAGNMTVQGQYQNGRKQNIATLDLSIINSYLVIGKFTKLIITLNALTGADTVVVSADQNSNIL
jgi:hypothetical protein